MSKMETISLTKEVYNRLNKLKKEGETISDVILRLIENLQKKDRLNLKSFEGIFEDSETWEKTENDIYRTRLIQRN